MCGKCVCDKCSPSKMTLKGVWKEPQRVCIGCKVETERANATEAELAAVAVTEFLASLQDVLRPYSDGLSGFSEFVDSRGADTGERLRTALEKNGFLLKHWHDTAVRTADKLRATEQEVQRLSDALRQEEAEGQHERHVLRQRLIDAELGVTAAEELQKKAESSSQEMQHKLHQAETDAAMANKSAAQAAADAAGVREVLSNMEAAASVLQTELTDLREKFAASQDALQKCEVDKRSASDQAEESDRVAQVAVRNHQDSELRLAEVLTKLEAVEKTASTASAAKQRAEEELAATRVACAQAVEEAAVATEDVGRLTEQLQASQSGRARAEQILNAHLLAVTVGSGTETERMFGELYAEQAKLRGLIADRDLEIAELQRNVSRMTAKLQSEFTEVANAKHQLSRRLAAQEKQIERLAKVDSADANSWVCQRTSTVWEPNASCCPSCRQAFSLLVPNMQRHHCRQCGGLTCGKCAGGEKRALDGDPGKQWICNACFESARERSSAVSSMDWPAAVESSEVLVSTPKLPRA